MSRIPGEFVPLDVRYRRDRSIRAAGAEAELLYLRGLALAKGEETGGMIEDYDIDGLTTGLKDPDAAVAALVSNDLWSPSGPTAWLIRSWEKWNPPADSGSAGRLGNHKRWHQSRGVVAPDCEFCVPTVAPDVAPDASSSSPSTRTDIAPDDRTRFGSESQNRVEKSREENKHCASDDAQSDSAQQPPETPPALVDTLADEFTEWWNTYPRKRDRKKAEQAYKSARKRATPETLLDGATRYAAEVATKPPDLIKHGSTWLNGDCWTNPTENLHEGTHPPTLDGNTFDDWLMADPMDMQGWRERWQEKLGDRR